MAWRKAKVRIVRDAAREQDDPRVYAGLLRHAARIESGDYEEIAAYTNTPRTVVVGVRGCPPSA